MLPLENKLKKKSDFENVYQKGNFFSIGSIYLKYCPNKKSSTRIGIIVSKKFSDKAPERNRVKRVLRSCAFDIIGDIKKGYDIVLFADKLEKENLNKKKILTKLKMLLEKSHLYLK